MITWRQATLAATNRQRVVLPPRMNVATPFRLLEAGPVTRSRFPSSGSRAAMAVARGIPAVVPSAVRSSKARRRMNASPLSSNASGAAGPNACLNDSEAMPRKQLSEPGGYPAKPLNTTSANSDRVVAAAQRAPSQFAFTSPACAKIRIPAAKVSRTSSHNSGVNATTRVELSKSTVAYARNRAAATSA